MIISDNFSEEDIGPYAASLGDSRIRYSRTNSFLPVTENWNKALEMASGDYIIMLGDDDALLPNYFQTIQELSEKHDQPDVLYGGGYIYAYPGVIADHPGGYLYRSGCAPFLRRSTEPFILDRPTAKRMVGHSLKIQMRFEYNMQYSTISRRVIDALRPYGPFFQSPFPDFYATNALFLKAPRILVVPQPLVIIGISPKSYGFSHFNQQDSVGAAFLNCPPDDELAKRLAHIVLPGSNMNTSWLYAMEVLCKNFGTEFNLRIDYERYRSLQILDYYRSRVTHSATPQLLRETAAKLRFGEKLGFGLPVALNRLIGRGRHYIRHRRRRFEQYPPDWKRKFIPQNCKNIREAVDFVGTLPPSGGAVFTTDTAQNEIG
jgi:glycosyltransferase involved in cell wall biosynthesis